MKKIGIIGLGLIGASILKKLSQINKYELFCVTNSSEELAKKYCKNVSSNIKIIQNCDIVFVCTKIDETLSTLEKLNTILDKNTLVADVCSIKKDLLEKKYNFDFILTHPMAGSEKSGFLASDENLFLSARWLIEKENELLVEIIKDLGAIPLKIDMKEQDKLCAQISHMPALLAILLFLESEDSAKLIASSGFRDMTRLAACQENLINSMFEDNLENIENALNNLIKGFKLLKNMDSNERINLFREVSNKRQKMYDENGKNIFKI